MKFSFLCGMHYEGADAHQHNAWPCPPALWDAEIGRRTFDDFLAYSALADSLGFDWISVSEHHFSPHILTPSLGAVAGALTQVVKRARIAMLGPLAPVNNPIRIAEEIAMLDQLSHGRLIVLPLRGTPNEYNSFGPIEAARSRAMTMEATLLIQKALCEPSPFAWNGEFFQFPTVSVWPRTVQQPFPPMFYSGNSLDSARFAGAQHLGMCTSFMPPPAVAQTVTTYVEAADAAGWKPTPDQIVHRNHIVVAETAGEAAELEANFLPTLNRKSISNNIRANRLGTGSEALMNEWATRLEQGKLLFAGTPDVIVERIEEFYAETGVGVLDLLFSAGPTPPAAIRRSIELFGTQVMPRVRHIGARTAALTQ